MEYFVKLIDELHVAGIAIRTSNSQDEIGAFLATLSGGGIPPHS